MHSRDGCLLKLNVHGKQVCKDHNRLLLLANLHPFHEKRSSGVAHPREIICFVLVNVPDALLFINVVGSLKWHISSKKGEDFCMS